MLILIGFHPNLLNLTCRVGIKTFSCQRFLQNAFCLKYEFPYSLFFKRRPISATFYIFKEVENLEATEEKKDTQWY